MPVYTIKILLVKFETSKSFKNIFTQKKLKEDKIYRET